MIAVLFKDVTATPPTEHNSGGNGASFEVSQSQPTPEQNKPRILNKHSRVGLSPWLPGTSLLSPLLKRSSSAPGRTKGSQDALPPDATAPKEASRRASLVVQWLML